MADEVAEQSEPLRDRAWALHCQGLKAPAIGQRLDVPERTVRAWLAADLKETAAERKAKRAERLTLAIERHLAIAAAARDAYHRAAEYDTLALDRLRAQHDAPDSTDDTASTVGAQHAALAAPAHVTAVAARYLNVALAAQREVARLEGLFLPPTPEIEDAPKSILLTTNDEIMVPPSLLPAWLAFRSWYDEHAAFAAQARPAEAPGDALTGDSMPSGAASPGADPAEKSAESAIPPASPEAAAPATPDGQDETPAPATSPAPAAAATSPSGPPMAPWPTEPTPTHELAAMYGPRVPKGISAMTLDELERYYHTYIPTRDSHRRQRL